jgi:hypothetical protein
MAAGHFQIFAPLQEFQWDGTEFELAAGLWIRGFDQKPELGGLDISLGKDEQDEIFFARSWLTFQWTTGTQPIPADRVSLSPRSWRVSCRE